MACNIIFTCVPLGKNGAMAQVDVIVTPSCDQKAQITTLQDWPNEVIGCANDFTLESGGTGPLGLDTSRIQPGLWNELFHDADVGAAGAVVSPSPIAPQGVSLTMTDNLAHDFYSKSNNRVINEDTHGPNLSFLNDLHNSAVLDHGLYQSGVAAAVAPAGGPAAEVAKAVASVLLSIPKDGQSDAAATLIHNRFGIELPVPAAGTVAIAAMSVQSRGTPIRTPEKATHALAHLKHQITNSIKQAAALQTVPASADPKPAHLLYHVNRLIASPSNRKASSAKKIADVALTRSPYSFNQRITLLLTMPAILEALGLVLRFTLPWNKATPAGPVQLKIPDKLKRFGSTSARITFSNALFLPLSKPGSIAILDNGWIQPTDGYKVGSLQLDSAAMQITQFANQVGLRQAGRDAQVAQGLAADSTLTTSYDEDVDHPLLPPSPHTGGVQVWHEDLQGRVIQQRQQALENVNDTSKPLYAEDLKNGVVVDVLAMNPNIQSVKDNWIHLCRRDEEYKINRFGIKTQKVERGVRTAAARPIDPGISESLSHEIDETVFTWRLGSLVAKSRLAKGGIASGTKTSSSGQIPWAAFDKPRVVESEPVPSPIFGWSYQVAMRASFVTGGVVPFDSDSAKKAALPPATFKRYELIQGPDLIPVTLTDHYLSSQTRTLMMVGSEINDDLSTKSYCELSQRVIVPAQVSPEVARRHGVSEDLINEGATVFPLKDGALPQEIISNPFANPVSSGSYLPDPLCSGVFATLSDLNGKVLGSASLDFYDQVSSWPNYTPHFVELRQSDDPNPSVKCDAITSAPGVFPFLTRTSRAFVCRVPPGHTYLLTLRPKLDPSVATVHAFSLLTNAGSTNETLSLERLALSDICRPTTVRLTHATDRPVQKPEVTMEPALAKQMAAVSVDRRNAVKLGSRVEPYSTSKVALISSWKEMTDDVNQASYESKEMRAQLSEFHVCKKSKDGVITPVKTQFPFADGRYRQLTVTARGTSRYGEVFGKGDPQSKTLDSEPLTLNMLATSQPLIPDIEYVLPNLRWQITKMQRTRTMGLTIVLNRPWFTSGGGEQLAIITSSVKDASSNVVDSIATSFKNANDENSVSAWGVMSDWSSALPDGAAKGRITLLPDSNRTADKDAAAPSPDLPISGIVSTGSAFYSAFFYSPRYNEQDQQWYVNVSLSEPPTYGAVIRLLVARYQRYSVDSASLSPVSICDFSLLRPERSVRISTLNHFFEKKMLIQITGVGPYVPETADGKTVPLTEIEVRHFETDPRKMLDFRWEQGKVVPMDANLPHTGNVLWQATLPYPWLGGMLFVRECEVWPWAEDPSQTISSPVYFDAIPL